MHRSLATALFLALTAGVPAQAPAGDNSITVCVVGPKDARYAQQMRNAAQLVAAEYQAKAQKGMIKVIRAECTTKSASFTKIVKDVRASGGFGVLLAPLEASLATAAQRAARGKLPCITFGHRPSTLVAQISNYLDSTYCARRIALAHDGSNRNLVKAMRAELPYPAELVLDFNLKLKKNKLDKKLADAQPELLVVDGDPKSVAKFLTTTWAGRNVDTVLTPRCFGEALRGIETNAHILLGRSPRTLLAVDDFVVRYEKKYGDPHYGMAEGHEAMTLLLGALQAAGDAPTSAKVSRALGGTKLAGTRGAVFYEPRARVVETPLALWKLEENAFVPHVPRLFYTQSLEATAGQEVPSPQTELGDPFLARRSSHFEPDDGSMWVLCSWGPRPTIDKDLVKLGLSTGGAYPTLDRMVKDELMARILSIASQKARRNADGSPIPGKSLNINFTTKLPKGWEKKKPRKRRKGPKLPRAWLARFAGNHPKKPGHALANRCEVFSSFIAQRIFSQHAVKPAIGVADLEYLDGRYKFGFDTKRNQRSETIRALINSYAASMAMTLVHQVGHLGGLEHSTGDEKPIMDKGEGADLDYHKAEFTAANFLRLAAVLGIVN